MAESLDRTPSASVFREAVRGKRRMNIQSALSDPAVPPERSMPYAICGVVDRDICVRMPGEARCAEYWSP
ncbi:hypothetical protein C8Q74DRAFT_1241611 [Fomes fomentarius]|nr:hypothetical protein C8Q74DRAFT_1241611 [Fomes fomentarius]